MITRCTAAYFDVVISCDMFSCSDSGIVVTFSCFQVCFFLFLLRFSCVMDTILTLSEDLVPVKSFYFHSIVFIIDVPRHSSRVSCSLYGDCSLHFVTCFVFLDVALLLCLVPVNSVYSPP